jgi:hypothetical protein
MRRIASPVLLALVLAALSCGGVAQAREGLRGPGYRSFAPTGWHVDKGHGNGWNTTQVTPPSHNFNGRDTALVSIAVASVKTVEKATHTRIRDKNKLVQQLISIPRNATGVETAVGPSPTTLHGKKGVLFGVHYDLKGTGTTHTATLVRRGRRIYLVQQITDQGVSDLGSSAADMIRATWRWK